MVVTLGQQYNVGEKPTVILYAYINRRAGAPFTVLSVRSMLFVVHTIILQTVYSILSYICDINSRRGKRLDG